MKNIWDVAFIEGIKSGSCMSLRRWFAATGFVLICCMPVAAQTGETTEQYDVVLQGGRVMDPETGLNAVRNIGIRDDRIVEITAAPLTGSEVVDVTGLIVAPGFIDLHAHGQTNRAHEFQAHDGVTTALELESGKTFVRQWLASRKGKALINYGASVAQAAARRLAMEKYASQAAEIRMIVDEKGLNNNLLNPLFAQMGRARYESLTSAETDIMLQNLMEGLEAGGLGFGVPVGYYPGATRGEIFNVFELAAKTQAPVYSHVRGINIAAIQEVIADAALTGAPLHIVHLNSISLGKIQVALDMVAAAQERKLDITTEIYPYSAASTGIGSVLFDPGWQKRLGISYGDLQWEQTGERLTRETFKKYRSQGGTIIIHMMKPEWITLGIKAPFMMIASDGMPYAPGAHPRSAGTFSRVLGRYVREQNTLGLMEALTKMTLMPAMRLQKIAPVMYRKGRLQVGSDADITVFAAEEIIDTATFEKDLSLSKGVKYVLVNGAFVIKNGRTVEDVFPGRAILGRYRN